MSRRLSGSIGLALLVAVTGVTTAFADDAPAPAPAATDTAAPAPAAAPAADTPAPAASASAAPVPKTPMTGYGYGGSRPSTRSSPSSDAPRHHGLYAHHANEAVAKFTGFEMLADGGSRLFVQLSKQVDVDPQKVDAPAPRGARKGKKGPGKAEAAVVSRIKFVLKGAEIVNPINEGALVTVHFNTPVLRARLVPAGQNLALMVELRADVTPEVKFVAAKDNGSMLQIDFPQGSYLPAGSDTSDPAAQPGSNGGSALPGTAPPAAAGAAPGAGATDSTESK